MIIQFFDKFAFAAHGVLRTRENRNRLCSVDLGKVFFLVGRFETVKEELEESNGHDVAALIVKDVFFDLLFVARKPCKRSLFALERRIVTAKGELVEHLARLLSAQSLVLHIGNRRAHVENRALHHCRAAKHCAGVILAFLDVALSQHRAIAVSEINHGKIVSFFEHRRDCAFVLHGVKIDVALVVALDAL